MIYLILVLLGLCMGSFVNALVWRLHQQGSMSDAKPSKLKKSKANDTHNTVDQYSILRGRSMCVDCRHTLGAKDLLPVISWLSLGGKCRYCHAGISWQYPLVELLTAGLFLASYIFWPYGFAVVGTLQLVFWLMLLVGLVALAVYDIRWFLLPNRIVYPLVAIAAIQIFVVAVLTKDATVLMTAFWGAVFGGGIFYGLFQVSGGKWIGGGDVRLGFLLGLIVGGPLPSLLVLFLASFLGSLVAVPLLASKRLVRSSRMPFGPFLIVAAIITQLFGSALISWYTQQFLQF